MNAFRDALAKRVLVLDGAMGTLLQQCGLPPGGCPEELNRVAADAVAGIHAEYAEAGADILVTNSFGGNRVKLANHNLAGAVDELNRRAVELARRVAPAGVFVGGSVGPTGRFVEPVGDARFDEMVDIFAEQISSLAGAGADLVCFESFLDIRELRAGLIACRDVCDLPIVAQMAFDDAGSSVPGSTPAAAAVTLDALGVDVIGLNGGPGVDDLHTALVEMREVTPRPLVARTSAGLPVLRSGEMFSPDTPDKLIACREQLVALGVRVIGGGCGTTPDHIRRLRAAFKDHPQGWTPPPRRGFLSSRGAIAEFGGAAPCVCIGERINPTGKRLYTEELRAGKTAYIRREAAAQVAAGAVLLDINCGAPGIDEAAALERAVYAAADACSAPLVIDTSDPVALERALKAADGKVLINSASGEAKSLARVLPLARRYGAALIALAFDEDGIPATAEGRVTVAGRIRAAALAEGLSEQDLVIDCLALAASAEPGTVLETLRTLRMVREKLGLATVLGVSNVSFGLPSRDVLSAVFFAMALEAGLKLAIINPKDERIMDVHRAASVLLGHDLGAAAYLARYADRAATEPASGGSPAGGGN